MFPCKDFSGNIILLEGNIIFVQQAKLFTYKIKSKSAIIQWQFLTFFEFHTANVSLLPGLDVDKTSLQSLFILDC